MPVTDVVNYYLEGRGPLWKLFWLWGVVGSWILFALFILAVLAMGVNWLLFTIATVIMLPYTVWILVSVWQCADNVGHPGWGDAARVLTFLWTVNIGIAAGILLTELVVGWN